MRACLLLPLLAACTGVSTGFHPPKEDSDTGTTNSGTVDTSPTDTADTDGDLDDDGYTPEEGDCNDDDIRVNPGRPEVVGDSKDNDCDGRIDETFAGVQVAWTNGSGDASIVTISLLGKLTDEVVLDNGCSPQWIAPLGDGWIINNGYASVAKVEADGTCTDLVDFSETDYGVWGVATSLDGKIYATTVDTLYEIGEDGSTTELAKWVVDFDVPANHEAAITQISVDAATGKLGLFDFFGGFATYDTTDGFQIFLRGDYKNPALVTASGTVQDGGRYYALASDTTTGAAGVYSFDLDNNSWVARDTWTDTSFKPSLMTIDSDSGDAYVTANGGWYSTVWRVVAGRNYAATLYMTDGTEEGRPYTGILPVYE